MSMVGRPALCTLLYLALVSLLACQTSSRSPAARPDPGVPAGSGGRDGGPREPGGTLGAPDAASVDSLGADAGNLDGKVDLASASDGGTETAPDGPPDSGSADASPGDRATSVAQTPPQGRRQLDTWLAAGHYKAWNCEPKVMTPRAGSPHGANRICSNDLASQHGAGPYPVGAASVKEIYYGTRIGVYAVSVKVTPGTTGNAWYWYEQNDLEGVGVPGCSGCHARAERSGGNDYVFVQVK